MLSTETEMPSWACGQGLVPPQKLRAELGWQGQGGKELGTVGRTMPVEAVNIKQTSKKARKPEIRHKIP